MFGFAFGKKRKVEVFNPWKAYDHEKAIKPEVIKGSNLIISRPKRIVTFFRPGDNYDRSFYVKLASNPKGVITREFVKYSDHYSFVGHDLTRVVYLFVDGNWHWMCDPDIDAEAFALEPAIHSKQFMGFHNLKTDYAGIFERLKEERAPIHKIQAVRAIDF